jgi:hypothetical protein
MQHIPNIGASEDIPGTFAPFDLPFLAGDGTAWTSFDFFI